MTLLVGDSAFLVDRPGHERKDSDTYSTTVHKTEMCRSFSDKGHHPDARTADPFQETVCTDMLWGQGHNSNDYPFPNSAVVASHSLILSLSHTLTSVRVAVTARILHLVCVHPPRNLVKKLAKGSTEAWRQSPNAATALQHTVSRAAPPMTSFFPYSAVVWGL